MPTKRKDIEEYNRKRDFEATPEPAGKKAKKSKDPTFVVQKHDASRLHYDFRLEVDGVLASWAVPKGPSINPKVRRLAVHVEDHPLDYASFEGNIPEGNYGAGSVIVWDRGTYTNLMADKPAGEGKKTVAKAIKDGMVEVLLRGEKLQGSFVLVRTDEEKDEWLLMKMKDDAVEGAPEPVEKQPGSVVSGRTVEEVAKGDSKAKKRSKTAAAGA